MTVRDKNGKITSCIFAVSGDAINEVLLKAAGEGIFGIDLLFLQNYLKVNFLVTSKVHLLVQ